MCHILYCLVLWDLLLYVPYTVLSSTVGSIIICAIYCGIIYVHCLVLWDIYVPEFRKLMQYLINANFASHFAGAFLKTTLTLTARSVHQLFLI